MKQWFAPLWIFIVGQAGLLFLLLFLPSVDSSVTNLASGTVAWGAIGWGWTWLMTQGVVRWLIYIGYEFVVIFVAGKALLKSKS